RVQQARDGGRPAAPVSRLDLELLAAGAREAVVLRSARILRRTPLSVEPPRALEPVEGGEQRAWIDLKHVACDLLDPARNPEAVQRLQAQRLEDEHVERALNDVPVLVHRGLASGASPIQACGCYS